MFCFALPTRGYSGVVVILKGPHGSTCHGVEAGGAEAAKPKPKARKKEAEAEAPACPPATSAPAEWGPAGAPVRVSFGVGDEGAYASEGRVVTVEVRMDGGNAAFACAVALFVTWPDTRASV